jgi:RNA polymerase sigma factor (sigma-70 family)
MPDERLARLSARGSEAAFAAIFERHHQALHRYCHSIVGNGHDASDALQTTMFKAYRALQGETREITLKPWLYRIAHNESISLVRARRSDSGLDAAAHLGDPATEGWIDSRDRLRSLAAHHPVRCLLGRGALILP